MSDRNRFLSLKNIFITRNRLKNARKHGNHTCSMKFILLEATTMPKMAKANTKSIKIISAWQITLESYQGVMDFLKNGLGSNCI